MRLITNLSYVTLGKIDADGGAVRGVRTMSHALVLQPPTAPPGALGGMSASEVLRGFGVDGALPTFDLALGDGGRALEYEGEDFEGNIIVLGEEGRATRVGDGTVLRWGDGTFAMLQLNNPERSLDIQDFDAGAYEALWAALGVKVAEYWYAPYMPKPQWFPVAQVLRARQRAS